MTENQVVMDEIVSELRRLHEALLKLAKELFETIEQIDQHPVEEAVPMELLAKMLAAVGGMPDKVTAQRERMRLVLMVLQTAVDDTQTKEDTHDDR